MGDDKDVTFQLKDGSERAHRAVLAAASDVFKSMLANDMREKSGVVELKDVEHVTMRVFLRLLYTGHASEEDWVGHEANAPSGAQVEEGAAAPPLDVLLSVLSIAKKYMCEGVLLIVVQTLKRRLQSADVGVFEQIMAGAIAADVGPLRMRLWRGPRA